MCHPKCVLASAGASLLVTLVFVSVLTLSTTVYRYKKTPNQDKLAVVETWTSHLSDQILVDEVIETTITPLDTKTDRDLNMQEKYIFFEKVLGSHHTDQILVDEVIETTITPLDTKTQILVNEVIETTITPLDTKTAKNVKEPHDIQQDKVLADKAIKTTIAPVNAKTVITANMKRTTICNMNLIMMSLLCR
jgi:hypothetical protein